MNNRFRTTHFSLNARRTITQLLGLRFRGLLKHRAKMYFTIFIGSWLLQVNRIGGAAETVSNRFEMNDRASQGKLKKITSCWNVWRPPPRRCSRRRTSTGPGLDPEVLKEKTISLRMDLCPRAPDQPSHWSLKWFSPSQLSNKKIIEPKIDQCSVAWITGLKFHIICHTPVKFDRCQGS